MRMQDLHQTGVLGSLQSCQVELTTCFSLTVGSVAGHAGLDLYPKFAQPVFTQPQPGTFFVHKHYIVDILTGMLGIHSCVFPFKVFFGTRFVL